jgi:hypothetical protein
VLVRAAQGGSAVGSGTEEARFRQEREYVHTALLPEYGTRLHSSAQVQRVSLLLDQGIAIATLISPYAISTYTYTPPRERFLFRGLKKPHFEPPSRGRVPLVSTVVLNASRRHSDSGGCLAQEALLESFLV